MYRIAINIMCYIISVISMYIYAFCMGRYILENKMMQKGVASHRCQEQLYMFSSFLFVLVTFVYSAMLVCY